MTQTPDKKAAARKIAFAARKAAFGEPDAVQRATRALLDMVGNLQGAIIAGYMPIRTEIDPLPAMAHLARENRVCVPVIDAPGLPLKFRQWTPDAEMTEGPFKALIPATGDWLEPDILIIPLVGFDAAFNRLGYGGGFYDRTLQSLRAKGQPRAIGFAFEAQRLPMLPVELTDQTLDAVVTDRAVHRP